jgi:Resolvase, N terminal domain/Tn3 transposase DDE domain
MSAKTMNSGFMASGSVADPSPATTGFPRPSGVTNPSEEHSRIEGLRRSELGGIGTLAQLPGRGAGLPGEDHLVRKAGAGFRSITEAVDTTTSAGRMVMQMLGSFAEFERSMVRERTRAGLAAARERGVKVGRPAKLSPHQQEEVIRAVRDGSQTAADAGRFQSVTRGSGYYLLLGVVVGDGVAVPVAAGGGATLTISRRHFHASPSRSAKTTELPWTSLTVLSRPVNVWVHCPSAHAVLSLIACALDRRQVSFVNQRHITEENLNQAITGVINAYAQLPLQRVWWLGQVRLGGWNEVGFPAEPETTFATVVTAASAIIS